MWIIVEEQKNEITQYLLGQLDEAGEEKVELRLLSDPDFTAEFDIVVDEIIIRYASGGFEGTEKDQVEQYFLRSRDRQDKAQVMCELLHRSATALGEAPVVSEQVAPSGDKTREDGDPGFFGAIRNFWSRPLVPRFALAMVPLVTAAVLVVWVLSKGPATTNFATLTLSASTAERGQPGDEVKSIKLLPGTNELRIQLLLPAQQAQPKTYRPELIPAAAGRTVTVVSQDAQSVQVSIRDLKPDRYAIRLFAVQADDRVERVPGSYLFRVE